jgi:large subunit ribosomal protein L32
MPHEPKKRHSKSAKRIRRASITLSAVSLVNCKNCGEKTLAHMACRSCGFYGGKATKDIKPQVKITKA